jgi:hypothetical protein
MAMLLAFWLITAVGRAYVAVGSTVLKGTGYESRYLYIAAVLVVLLTAELLRGIRVSPLLGLAATVAVAFAVAANIGVLRLGGAFQRSQAANTVTALGTLDMTRDIVSPTFTSSGFLFGILKAGPYFAAERALGTLAASPAEIAQEPEGARAAADEQLITIHHVTLASVVARPTASGVPVQLEAAQGGAVTRSGACVRFAPSPFTPAGAVASVSLTLPPAGLEVQARGGTVTIGVRRFASAFTPLGTLAPAHPARLAIGPDLASATWHVNLAPTVFVLVCPAGG